MTINKISFGPGGDHNLAAAPYDGLFTMAKRRKQMKRTRSKRARGPLRALSDNALSSDSGSDSSQSKGSSQAARPVKDGMSAPSQEPSLDMSLSDSDEEPPPQDVVPDPSIEHGDNTISCASGEMCMLKHIVPDPTKHTCPTCQKPVHGFCGVEDETQPSAVHRIRCFLCHEVLATARAASSKRNSRGSKEEATNAIVVMDFTQCVPVDGSADKEEEQRTTGYSADGSHSDASSKIPDPVFNDPKPEQQHEISLCCDVSIKHYYNKVAKKKWKLKPPANWRSSHAKLHEYMLMDKEAQKAEQAKYTQQYGPKERKAQMEAVPGVRCSSLTCCRKSCKPRKTRSDKGKKKSGNRGMRSNRRAKGQSKRGRASKVGKDASDDESIEEYKSRGHSASRRARALAPKRRTTAKYHRIGSRVQYAKNERAQYDMSVVKLERQLFKHFHRLSTASRVQPKRDAKGKTVGQTGPRLRAVLVVYNEFDMPPPNGGTLRDGAVPTRETPKLSVLAGSREDVQVVMGKMNDVQQKKASGANVQLDCQFGSGPAFMREMEEAHKALIDGRSRKLPDEDFQTAQATIPAATITKSNDPASAAGY